MAIWKMCIQEYVVNQNVVRNYDTWKQFVQKNIKAMK